MITSTSAVFLLLATTFGVASAVTWEKIPGTFATDIAGGNDGIFYLGAVRSTGNIYQIRNHKHKSTASMSLIDIYGTGKTIAASQSTVTVIGSDDRVYSRPSGGGTFTALTGQNGGTDISTNKNDYQCYVSNVNYVATSGGNVICRDNNGSYVNLGGWCKHIDVGNDGLYCVNGSNEVYQYIAGAWSTRLATGYIDVAVNPQDSKCILSP